LYLVFRQFIKKRELLRNNVCESFGSVYFGDFLSYILKLFFCNNLSFSAILYYLFINACLLQFALTLGVNKLNVRPLVFSLLEVPNDKSLNELFG